MTSISFDLLTRLREVRRAAIDRERSEAAFLTALDPSRRASAANLLHYLAMRGFDLRCEQRELARLGLSSLGRCEAHVLATLDAVIGRLAGDVGEPDEGPAPASPHGLLLADDGDQLLADHAGEVLGPPPPNGTTRVMVTLPSEAATDPHLVRTFAEAGMAVARINCAHDDPEAWRAMAANVQAAAAAVQRPIKIACDLAGPKLRTASFEPGPAVLKLKPQRDAFGTIIAPVVARFVVAPPGGERPVDAGRSVPLTDSLGAVAEPGDELRFRDARGRKRRFVVRGRGLDGSLFAQGDRTSYLVAGLEVDLTRNGALLETTEIASLPSSPGSVRLDTGDTLELVFGDEPGSAATIHRSARVSIPIPEVFTHLQVGERVLFDDGSLQSVVIEADPDRVLLEMTHVGPRKLGSGKGINLPDTELRLRALTEEDLAALEEVAPFADLVALSFVDDPADVARLQFELDRLGALDTGIILKIERRSAFETLPRLLMQAMRRPPAAVMVARGDLAVEIGFERLAEVQEEILWLCEAAHIPVIWATQVLETLAKSGMPTRAEVTDAAWASRAECVMLNKGPHIDAAMAMLDDIVNRMRQHQDKRVPMLRPLAVAALR